MYNYAHNIYIYYIIHRYTSALYHDVHQLVCVYYLILICNIILYNNNHVFVLITRHNNIVCAVIVKNNFNCFYFHGCFLTVYEAYVLYYLTIT
jgi:hypothetical protein